MKIGAIVIVNCDKNNIWFCLKGIYDVCDKVIVVHSDCNWNGVPRDDGTLAIIQGFKDPDEKLQIITGSFTSQPGQRTVALEILKEEKFDYCFIVDSDEIYHPDQLQWARKTIEANPMINIFDVQWRSLWKTLDYMLVPDDGVLSAFYRISDDFYFTKSRGTSYKADVIEDRAIAKVLWNAILEVKKEMTFLKKALKSREDGLKKRRKGTLKRRRNRLKRVRLKVEREEEILENIKKEDLEERKKVQTLFLDPNKIVCYHLTAVCDDEQMLEKIQTRSYKDNICSNWYEEKWLNWTLDTCDLHPVKPAQYERAVFFDKEKELPLFMKKHTFWTGEI